MTKSEVFGVHPVLMLAKRGGELHLIDGVLFTIFLSQILI